jgi:osmoprotectant transport system ATP-binding protein
LGFTALLVTHDLAEAARLADQLVVMRHGKVEQAGAARDLQRAPAIPCVSPLRARHAARRSR